MFNVLSLPLLRRSRFGKSAKRNATEYVNGEISAADAEGAIDRRSEVKQSALDGANGDGAGGAPPLLQSTKQRPASGKA